MGLRQQKTADKNLRMFPKSLGSPGFYHDRIQLQEALLHLGELVIPRNAECQVPVTIICTQE